MVISARERAVAEGRALERVREKGSGRLLTIAVCPGRWNEPSRGAELLRELATRGRTAVAANQAGSEHAAMCLQGKGRGAKP